jgi:hypothetical protein
VTNDLLLDAADTLADIDQQARVLCGSCDPAKPVAPPNALSSGAGAASVSSLIAHPVSQVQADAAAVAAAHAAGLKALRQGAETQAGTLPQLPNGADTVAGETPTYIFPGTSGNPDNPLASTITTPDGHLLPTVRSGAAVSDLVTGVTGTLSTATGGATDPVTKPVGDAVKKVGDAVGDTVGKATDGLLP